MRIKALFLSLALCVALPLAAQESEFPTLDALAELEIPAFSYADMVGRMSGMTTNHVPPPEPPQYEIGDRETFRLLVGENIYYESVAMELRGLTDRVLIWVQDDVDYPRWRARNIAQRLETYVLDPMQRLFQFSEPPGIDGDPRLNVALMLDPSGAALAYFHKSSTLPQLLYEDSNQREMLVVNLSWDEDYDYFDHLLVEVVAHEYVHILHHHSDLGEEKWLDEGLASYAGYMAGKSFLRGGIAQQTADGFLEAPQTGLTQWHAVEELRPKYGAAFLFILYLAEQFGEGIVPAFLKEKANGWHSVVEVLRQYTDVSADEVFADWALANYFQDFRRGYGYKSLDADLSAPEPAASYNRYPAAHDGYLPQYSTEYITVDVRGGGKLTLSLRQAPEARLIDMAPAEGEQFYFGLATDGGNARLKRAFDLSGAQDAQLRFKIWYDLDDNREYGYVNISDDAGANWQTLPGNYTERSGIYSLYYGEGYTAGSGRWRTERIDLSDYGRGQVLISFEVVSHIDTGYGGMAIDDLRIDAIGFHDGFETADDAWIEAGWIRTDNRLPNNTWLQAVQETRGGLNISRSLVSGSGDLHVDILPGVSEVLVAISPVVPQINRESEYTLELNLFDAAGAPMAAARECQVRTTTGLNFRDAPGGDKIGLLPVGTSVYALASRDGWFNVEYDGLSGWVHGDYVTKAGNCEL